MMNAFARPCRLRKPDAAADRSVDAAGARELSGLRRTLLRYAIREMRNVDAAEDVTQDAMLALMLAPERYRGEASFDVYAISVLKHKIMDSYRSHKREAPMEPELLDTMREAGEFGANAEADPQDVADGIDARRNRSRFWRTLRECVASLPERTRTAFILRDVQEWDMDVVCRHLGVSETHVSVMAHRARAHIRARMGPLGAARLPSEGAEVRGPAALV